MGSELEGEHLGELDDRSLARRVRGLTLHRHEARGDLGAKSAFQSFGGSRCRRQTRDSRCSTKPEDVDSVGRVHGNMWGYGVVGPHVHPGVARPQGQERFDHPRAEVLEHQKDHRERTVGQRVVGRPGLEEVDHRISLTKHRKQRRVL